MYLEGDSFISGDLLVEGSLQVKKVVTPSGDNLPYFYNGKNSYISNRLLKVINSPSETETGAIESSYLDSTWILNNEVIKSVSTSSFEVVLDIPTVIGEEKVGEISTLKFSYDVTANSRILTTTIGDNTSVVSTTTSDSVSSVLNLGSSLKIGGLSNNTLTVENKDIEYNTSTKKWVFKA